MTKMRGFHMTKNPDVAPLVLLRELMGEPLKSHPTEGGRRFEIALESLAGSQIFADVDTEPRRYLSVTQFHDGDELCLVVRGVLRFRSGPNSFVDLDTGRAVVIRRHPLPDAVPLSESSRRELEQPTPPTITTVDLVTFIVDSAVAQVFHSVPVDCTRSPFK